MIRIPCLVRLATPIFSPIVLNRPLSVRNEWLNKHKKDKYVKRRDAEGAPSRAAYKLLEFPVIDSILFPGARVLDLGACPGGWSRVARARVVSMGYIADEDLWALPKGSTRWHHLLYQWKRSKTKQNGQVIGVDIAEEWKDIAMEGVVRVQLDFTRKDAVQHLQPLLREGKCDVLLSDAAPNVSGIWDMDCARSHALARSSARLGVKLLAHGGCFVAKVFQNQEEQELLPPLRTIFASVDLVRSKVSRASSAEMFLICQGFQGPR